MHSQLIRNFIVFSAIVVISVCIITVVVLRGNAKIDQSKEQIIYSHDLITLTKSLTSEIEAMLANQRGYFLTGDQSYLNDYTTSKSILDEYLSTLDIIAKDAQKEKLDTLKNQINLYVEKLDEAMANFKPQKSQLNSQNREVLKQFSNTINDVNAEIVGQEYTTLNNRITYFQDKQKKYQETLLAIAFITGTLLIIFNIWLLRAQINLLNAKKSAEKATKAKGDFLAHMSHEIRTPLTAISGASEILNKKKEDYDPRTAKLLGVIGSSAASLKDLITDILDFSKIESNQIDLDYAYHNLDALLQQVISIMSVRANEKGLDFKVTNTLEADTKFYCDKARLRQILINLVGNAIKFTEEGAVEITIKQTEKRNITNDKVDNILEFSVTDQGIGIPQDKLNLIFEEFQQADASVSRRFGGTGLGLSISKKLAYLMNGSLSVVSQEGQGSTFSLTLPAKLKSNTPITHPPIKSKIKKVKHTPTDDRVLVVEDYEGNIIVLTTLLEDLGISYDIARTGVEAIAAFSDNHYQVILMDIQMPEMDGLTATATIRRTEETENLTKTPIIGMTAHALLEDKQKCIEAGMNDFIPKPIDEESFIKTLKKYLTHKKEAA